MSTPHEKLAGSLEKLRELQTKGKVAIRAADLPRVHRERLLKNGFLRPVMKGWYIPVRPEEPVGESTAWYASFWDFCATYLNERFGDDWCLSPEHSLDLHARNTNVPNQLLVRSPKASGNITSLPHDTSLMDVAAAIPAATDVVIVHGLRLYSIPTALIAVSPTYFHAHPTDARTLLSLIADPSDLLKRLLEGGHTVVAGRLAGAFRNIGRHRVAEEIIEAMRVAGYASRENDPFERPSPSIFNQHVPSPYAARVRLMWQEMRVPILRNFPAPPGRPTDVDAYMKRVEETYVTDAYHSLSIEGYRVSRELIDHVRTGNWNPDTGEGGRKHRNALAARGYWQASQAVRRSLRRILAGESAGMAADEDHGTWYRELFAPSVQAGILKPADLAGYRTGQVYIRGSMHVPPSREGVRDCMPAFFDLLREEIEPAVRVVLGHFLFVYVHPYMDGNGRVGRFLMNAMLASGGYPWTVIPVERRNEYVASLEKASVGQEIRPFAEFLGRLVANSMKGESEAKPPE